MPGKVASAADLAAALSGQLDVSRETQDRLTLYAERLQKWNKAINLVARSTIGDLWHRHMLDSAQAASHIPAGATRLLDLGSGGGFPGLVTAILLEGRLEVHLVDSDQRKCAFLRDVSRETQIPVTVHAARIEGLALGDFDVVSARACAPLAQLCAYAAPFWKKGTVGLFLKGIGAEQELTHAREAWTIEADLIPSMSDPQSHLVRVSALCAREPDGGASDR